MQQSADHILLVTAITMGARCRLKYMGQSIDRKTSRVSLQNAQVSENAIRQGLAVESKLPLYYRPVLGCTRVHTGEAGPARQFKFGAHLISSQSHREAMLPFCCIKVLTGVCSCAEL